MWGFAKSALILLVVQGLTGPPSFHVVKTGEEMANHPKWAICRMRKKKNTENFKGN